MKQFFLEGASKNGVCHWQSISATHVNKKYVERKHVQHLQLYKDVRGEWSVRILKNDPPPQTE